MAKYGTKATARRLIHFSSWIGLDSLRSTYRQIREMSSEIMSVRSSERVETFDEAMSRLHLSEEDIQSRINDFKFRSQIYLVILILGLMYLFYLIYHQLFTASLMMLSFSMLMFSFYFRESFWSLQLQERRLGLTFSYWFYRMLKIK